MRRIATWLLVGAVAALGVAAGIDALRGDVEPERAEPEARSEPAAAESGSAERTLVDARADLRDAGVSGVLTYADEACRLHSVTLPDLEPHPGPRGEACIFESTVGNEFVFAEPSGGSYGDPTPRCRGGWVELLLPDGSLLARARGRCGFAWRPDGTPTFLRGGEVMQFAPCADDGPGEFPIRCSRAVVSRADLAREFRRASWIGFDLVVEELRWLTDTRFAAVVGARRGPSTDHVLAVFEGRRLVHLPGFGYEALSSLRPSPSGAFVAARIGQAGIAVVDRDGRPTRPAIRTGSALTWSPDERWIAEATADGIYVFRADEPNPAILLVPIVARDLVWR